MSSNWRQGGRGGGKPRSNYWPKNDNKGKRKHQYKLEPGVTGFLCTCVAKLKERDCVRDGYNILNEYADKLFGPEMGTQTDLDKGGKESECPDDVDQSLEDELKELKSVRDIPVNERRFQVVESGAKAIVFIKTTVPDPVALCHEIVSSVAESKVQKSKVLLRLLPVEVVCYANVNDITKAADPLFDKYFKEGNKTFAIVFSHKNNDNISRDAVIESLAALVSAKNPTNKADLKGAELAILVEVIRGVCCLSVMPDYFKLKKYNILELSNVAAETEKDLKLEGADTEANAGKIDIEESQEEEKVEPTKGNCDEKGNHTVNVEAASATDKAVEQSGDVGASHE